MNLLGKNITRCYWVARSGVFLATLFLCVNVFANPVLDHVAAGDVAIQQSPNSTVINQSSQQAIINWHSFNIGASESTHFQQPAGGIALNRISPTDGASAIYGRLTATGQIILANPAGIFFGPNAYVNVGGLIATTGNISDQNFLNGYYHITPVEGYAGSIINQGTIIAANHGLVALIGNQVSNNGLIQANLGKVILSSGSAFTLSFAGNDLINFTIDQKAVSSGGVENTGSLIANGGTIIVSAKSAQTVLDNVINMEGVLQARSVDEQEGEIILSGDEDAGVVRVAGDIDVSGLGFGEHGGNVKITGYNILLDSPTRIDASGSLGGGEILIGGNYQGKGPLPNANALYFHNDAKIFADAVNTGDGGQVILWSNYFTGAHGDISAHAGANGGDGGFIETSSHNVLDANGIHVNLTAPNGNAGTWLLDPNDLTITSASDDFVTGSSPFQPTGSGSKLNVGTLQAALELGGANVIAQTYADGEVGNGDIIINSSLTYNSLYKLTISAFHDILGNASILNNGAGDIVLRADNTGLGLGTVQFTGGNNVTTTGGKVNIYYNPDNFGIQNPMPIYIGGTTPTQYMLINELGSNINDTTSRSLANLANNPTFWNQNFALAKDIDASATSNVGIWLDSQGFKPIATSGVFSGKFDGQGYAIKNLYINRPAQTGVGLFSNLFEATIQNLFMINPNITGLSQVGVFAGLAQGSGFVTTPVTLENLHTDGGTVTATGPTSLVGGIAGYLPQYGRLSNSHSSTTVIGNGTEVGGLVGRSLHNQIYDSYATGAVSGLGNVGGLVGSSGLNDEIDTSYASGTVTLTGGGSAGGLVGSDDSTTFYFLDFYDTQTGYASSAGDGMGVTGIPTIQMKDMSNFAGWVINNTISSTAVAPSNTWFIFDGQTRPILMSEWNTSISTAHQLQLMGTTLGANYTLSQNIDASGTRNASDIWGTSLLNGGVGFVPIAQSATFSGNLNGQHFAIDNLYINSDPAFLMSQDGVGLISTTSSGSIIYNIGLTNALVMSTASDVNTGILIGNNNGIVDNAYTTGQIYGTGAANVRLGGLVGLLNGGSISNSYSAVDIQQASVSSYATIGGLVGTNAASSFGINTSFSTGRLSLDASNAGLTTASIGGFVGENLSTTGSISNSYSLGNVIIENAANPSLIRAGGFVGYSNAPIQNSFSTGYVTGAAGSVMGGFVGINDVGSTLSTVFWDTGTSGQASGYGSSSPNSPGSALTGGCFGGPPCAFGGGVDLTQEATFTFWDFSHIWGIIPGQSYPYLTMIYSTTPRAISGLSNVGADNEITLASLGSNLATTRTGYNGFYYFLVPDGAIADGNSLITYVTTGATNANGITIAPTAGGSVTGLNLSPNSITIGDDSVISISNTDLPLAIGGLTSPYILYNYVASDLSINSGVNFITNPNVTYRLDGNLTSAGGAPNFTFQGPLLLMTRVFTGGTLTTMTANGGTFNFAKIDDTVANAHLLTVDAGSTGAIHFNDDVGLTTTIQALNASALFLNLSHDIQTSNSLSLVAQFSLNFSGNLTATNQVTLTSFNDLINQINGTVTTALLTTSSATGTTMTNSNNVAQYAAANSTSGDIVFNNGGALDIATINQTAGNLQITTAGALTQTNNIVVSGNSAFTTNANSSITLNNTNNNFGGSVSVTTTGFANVNIRNANLLTLGNLSLGSGSLTLRGTGITELGSITQAGAAGNVAINAGNGVINLSNPNNHFTGNVFLDNTGANAVNFNNTGALLTLGPSTFGSSSISIQNTGTLTLNSLQSSGGNLSLVASSINLAGDLTSGGGSISISGPTSLLSNIAVNSGFGAGNTIHFIGNVTGVGRTLTVQNLPGSIIGDVIFSGNVNLGNLVTGNKNYSITMTGASNTFSSAVSLQNTGSVNLGDASTDVFNFNGGYSNSGTTNFFATVNSNNTSINLGNANVVGTTTINAGSSGDVTLNGTMGALGAGDLTISAHSINVNGPSITVEGNQTYNNQVVLGANTNFVLTGASPASITFAQGIGGNKDATFTGNASSNIFNFQGSLLLNSASVSASGASSNNNLIVNSAGNQSWTITGNNAGNLTGVSGLAGALTYDHIDNLTGGGNHDVFTLAGGTLSGGINGGGGVNTLAGDNVVSYYTINNVNSGTATGIGTSFINIQNLVGGAMANTFTFTGNGQLTGTLDGGLTTNTNTLAFVNYNTPVNIFMANLTDGTATTDANALITNYQNINNLTNNSALFNGITLPDKSNVIYITGFGAGYIGDPTYFTGFTSIFSQSGTDVVHILYSPIIINPDNSITFGTEGTMYFNNFGNLNLDVSKIIQQPDSNKNAAKGSGWNYETNSVGQNIDDLSNQAKQDFENNLSKLVINPFCTASS